VESREQRREDRRWRRVRKNEKEGDSWAGQAHTQFNGQQVTKLDFCTWALGSP
jgi:hypothetical protein